tara:strand:- start:144 stop:383 length:240 start_codon:yes stop_codon:yes gene_type:complete
MAHKFFYVVDHFVPYPQSEYGGVWNVIAKNDEECFDIIVSDDDELYFGCYSTLRENISKSVRFPLADDETSQIVHSFIT